MARQKRRNSNDNLIRNLCVRFNSTWGPPAEHIAKALEGRGMTVAEFHELAQDVKSALRQRRAHPATDFVHEIQQLASRFAPEKPGTPGGPDGRSDETSNED